MLWIGIVLNFGARRNQDPTFRYDADPDTHPYPTPTFIRVGRSEIFLTLHNAQLYQFTLFCFSRQRHRWHSFQYF